MAALHDLHWDFLFSHQMICKQHIILNCVFFQYESNLNPLHSHDVIATAILLIRTNGLYGI